MPTGTGTETETVVVVVLPECEHCQDSGMVAEEQNYPWGGSDWLYVFCSCSVGQQAEVEAYEMMRW